LYGCVFCPPFLLFRKPDQDEADALRLSFDLKTDLNLIFFVSQPLPIRYQFVLIEFGKVHILPSSKRCFESGSAAGHWQMRFRL
jgi:hypothetical protein